MAQIGYVLSHEQFRTPQLLEFSVAAERAGFDMLWTSDHFHPWQDNQGHAGQAWITLAAVGQKVSLPFGTGVTCPTFRYHPAVVAQAFASLGVLYPGRVFLGLGTGEALNEQAVTSEWGDYDERAERFMEAVQIIRQLHTGEWTSFAGDYYEVGPAKLYDIPEQPVPLYLAAEGPKAMHLAGKFGDGVISDSKTLMQPEMRQQFEAGAREAGKDPAAMTKHAEQFVIVGGEAERDAAARLWRFLPKAWTDYVNDPDPRDIEKGALATITPGANGGNLGRERGPADAYPETSVPDRQRRDAYLRPPRQCRSGARYRVLRQGSVAASLAREVNANECLSRTCCVS